MEQQQQQQQQRNNNKNNNHDDDMTHDFSLPEKNYTPSIIMKVSSSNKDDSLNGSHDGECNSNRNPLRHELH